MNTDFHEHGAPGDQHRQAALVIHPEIRGNDLLRDADSALAEAVSLAQALPGIQVIDGLVVRLPRAQCTCTARARSGQGRSGLGPACARIAARAGSLAAGETCGV